MLRTALSCFSRCLLKQSGALEFYLVDGLLIHVEAFHVPDHPVDFVTGWDLADDHFRFVTSSTNALTAPNIQAVISTT
jgi:hypothetical protein